jgi:hypothetical protein
MLAFPCLSGLVLGGLSVPGAAIVTVAVAGLPAHEAALILLGTRGARLKASHGAASRRRLLSLGAVSILAVTVFAFTAATAAWIPAAITAGLTVAVGVLLLAKRTKTLSGELFVAVTFASLHGVVAGAGAIDRSIVYLPAVVWAASFALATLSVHALKCRFKGSRPGRWTVWAAPTAAGVVIAAAALVLAGSPAGDTTVLALLPKALLVGGLAVVTVHPRHLKRVGWSLVVADVLTLTILGWLYA